MDHAHSHAVFLEIAFGLNTVFAIYHELQGFIAKAVTERVDEASALIGAIEVQNGSPDIQRVNYIASQVDAMAKGHNLFQEKLFRPVAWAAVVSALICVAILYFDGVGSWGYACGFLILPFPIFALISSGNYAAFRFRAFLKVRRYKGYKAGTREFEPPQLPSQFTQAEDEQSGESDQEPER